MRVLFFFLMLLPACRAVAWDPSAYPPGTLAEVRARYWGQRDTSVDSTMHLITIPMGVPFRAEAVYLREMRPLDSAHAELLELLDRSRGRNFSATLTREVRVRDRDGRIHWVPIQRTFEKDFEAEVGPCGKVDLYLLWFMATSRDDLILMNEFEAKPCEDG
jgi:hypothetical protein